MISPLKRVAKSTASYLQSLAKNFSGDPSLSCLPHLGFAGARGTDDGNEGLHCQWAFDAPERAEKVEHGRATWRILVITSPFSPGYKVQSRCFSGQKAL
jgi:hypothetical protein